MNKNTKRESNMLLTLFLFAFFMLPFSFMQASNVFATASTITLSVTGRVGLNITSLDAAGNFASSDTETNNISVSTNNGTGYTLSIKASVEGSNALINTTDSSKTIPSHNISAGVSKTNYNDASYASANNLNNTWGFRPSTYYDATNNITIDNTTSNLYFPGPSSATNQFIIDKTSSANATANEYNIALGTRINDSAAPGQYANSFVITAVANPILYSITYNQNTTETVTNMPTNVVDQPTFDETVNIDSTVPVRDGFNFKGWCTVQVADGGTCSGTTYNPDGGGTDLAWTLDQTVSSSSLTIYAMWEQALTMQTAKFSDCSKTMPDSRDGQRYTTALIGDNCWMTTNLDLAGGTALSADDTDVTSSYISSFTTSNNLTKSGDTIVLPASSTSRFDTNNYSYVYNSGKTGTNCSSPGCYSYYSWDAATLGSGRTITTDNTNAEQSICPKGWHLPTTYNGSPNDSTDFRKLMIALGGSAEVQNYNDSSTPTGATMSTSLQANPNNFLRAGFYFYGSFNGGGSYGYYWSSTSYSNSSNARNLYFGSINVSSASSGSRGMGYSVRCVMDKTMQDVGSWESQVGAGGETTAVDKRDGAEYTIARLADGNLWMTQNLRFQGTDLKVGESDVTSDITMNYGSLTSGDSYTEPRIATGSTTDYGTYYNFCAASAGEVCNDTTSQDATRSVCPAGWKLPTRAQLNALPQKESHFTAASGLAGLYYGGSLGNAGTNGYWWASTAFSSATGQYILNYLGSIDLWFVTGISKDYGLSARCVRAS